MDKPVKSGGTKKGESFKVIVRVRPCLPHEERTDAKHCVSIDVDRGVVTIKKPESRRKSSSVGQLIGIDGLGDLVKSDPISKHDFNFDIIFSPSTTQEMVYDACVHDIVVSVLEGYNGSIIAYGQTGTGKSYTIEGGVDEHRGIVPRAADAIFHYIQTNADSNAKFLVRASFLEIYNEKLSDLMNPARDNLKIRDGGVGETYIEGLSEHILKTAQDVHAILKKGLLSRITAETRMNKESSRSHAVFTIIVEHSVADEDGSGSTVTVGKLRLVDLAGSEKFDAEARGRQQEETKNINVSLHYFGKVVMSLTSPGNKHIPYRDSKLTRILQDSLGGNCKTAMITTISPMSTCYGESFRSLDFAKRAKLVKNNAVINKDLSHKAMLSAYETEIRQLKKQLSQKENIVDIEQLEKLREERQKVEQEKDEVLSELQAQQAKTHAAQAEKEEFMKRISQLENQLLTGGNDVKGSDEFHKALESEKERIRQETEIQFQKRFLELEKENKRLAKQKTELEKEMLTKIRSEPDGKKDDGNDEVDSSSTVKTKPLTASGIAPKSLSTSSIKKPLAAPVLTHPPSAAAINILKIPHSRVQATSNQSISSDPGVVPRPVSGVSVLTIPSRPNSGPSIGQPGPVQRLSRPDYEPPGGPAEAFVSSPPPTAVPLSPNIHLTHPTGPAEAFVASSPPPATSASPARPQLDDASIAALQEYARALAHPVSGIPCQELQSGIRIFTGSGAVQWFLTNMESINTIQKAQDVGQRLMDLNVFIGIQGSRQFVVSDSVYYQFSDIAGESLHNTSVSSPPRYGSRMLNPTSRPSSVMSVQSVDQYGSYYSVQGDQLMASQSSYKAPAVHSSKRSSWGGSTVGSNYSLMDQSTSSLSVYTTNGADVMEQAGLAHLSPSPLHCAAIQGDRSRLKMLAREVDDVDVRDMAGNTPLMYTVMGRQPKCCLQLLRLGARVNATNHDGLTALMVATQKELEEMVKILLKHGALTHFVNHDGETAYHIAAKSENFKCLEYLCKYSSDLQSINERDHHYQTALHNAVTANLPGNAKRLLTAKADLGASDDQGCTALHYAVSSHSLPCVQAIVETNKNDVNLVDTNGQSALHLACVESSIDCINYLLSTKECNINLKDKDLSTPLHLATKVNRPNVVKVLVQHRANITIRDTAGKSPLHYAMQMGYTDCAHAIQSHGQT